MIDRVKTRPPKQVIYETFFPGAYAVKPQILAFEIV